eukprot:1148863-Pelagomonas_calceolata.AAC.1
MLSEKVSPADQAESRDVAYGVGQPYVTLFHFQPGYISLTTSSSSVSEYPMDVSFRKKSFFSFYLLLTPSCIMQQTRPHTEDCNSQPRETTAPTEC